MPLSAHERSALAHDALSGLATGDAVGNRGFRPQARVGAPPQAAGRWAWTDDTEMACSVVDVLDRFGAVDQDELIGCFARRAEPGRDYGSGAWKILQRVRAGENWRAVTGALFDGAGSWGNGGAMRVAPLGAYFADDAARAAAQAGASAEVTHGHPEGVAGAVAVGAAAATAASLRGQELKAPAGEIVEAALEHAPAGQVAAGLRRALGVLGGSAETAVAELGNGSLISAPDTVPFALWVAAKHVNNYAAAVLACVAAGGDMDTTAAIAGGVIAAHHGAHCVPEEWAAAREPLPAWLAAPAPQAG